MCFSHLLYHIKETGSNAVEKLWSGTGGYGAIGNGQRDYGSAEGRRIIQDLVTLAKYDAEGSGLSFGKEDRGTQRDLITHLHEESDLEDAFPSLHLSHFDATALISAGLKAKKKQKSRLKTWHEAMK